MKLSKTRGLLIDTTKAKSLWKFEKWEKRVRTHEKMRRVEEVLLPQETMGIGTSREGMVPRKTELHKMDRSSNIFGREKTSRRVFHSETVTFQ